MEYGNLDYLDEFAYLMRRELGPFTEEHCFFEGTSSVLLVFKNDQHNEFSIWIDKDAFGHPRKVVASEGTDTKLISRDDKGLSCYSAGRKEFEGATPIDDIICWLNLQQF